MTQPNTPEVEPQVEDQQPEAEVQAPDWQTRAEAAEAQLKKVENDRNSQAGRVRQAEGLNHQLTSIGDRLGAIEEANHAMMRAWSSGETDTLSNDLSTIQARAAQTSANRTYAARYADLSGELQEAVKDGDGNPILDLHEAPELEEIRREWVAAHKAQDAARLGAVLGQVHRIVRQAEKTTGVSAIQKVRDEERAAARTRMEEAGIYDLDTGPAGGGGGAQDDWTWFTQTYGKMPNPTAADHRRATRINKGR